MDKTLSIPSSRAAALGAALGAASTAMAHRVGRTPRRAPRVFARPTVARSNAVPLTLAARHERSIHAFNSSVAASRLVSNRTEPNPSNRPDRAFIPRPTHDATDSRDSFTRSTPPTPSAHASIEPILVLAVVAIFSRSRAHSFAHRIRAPLLARLSRLASPRLASRPTVSHRLPPSHAPRIVVAILRRPSSSSSVVVCRASASVIASASSRATRAFRFARRALV